MWTKNHDKNFLPKILILIFVLSFFVFDTATAQQSAPALSRVEGPKLLITWRAESYVPPWFAGKALPTANSGLTASVELMDSGRAVNVSGQKIYWYVNSEPIGSGVGLQRITFAAHGVAGNTLDLRAEIPSYQFVLKTVEIPTVDPEAVIEAPYANRGFSSLSPNFSGWPFFFNVKRASDLATSWLVNGASAQSAEDPGHLTVNLNQDAPPGANLNIALTISAPGNLASIATKMVNLMLSRER